MRNTFDTRGEPVAGDYDPTEHGKFWKPDPSIVPERKEEEIYSYGFDSLQLTRKTNAGIFYPPIEEPTTMPEVFKNLQALGYGGMPVRDPFEGINLDWPAKLGVLPEGDYDEHENVKGWQPSYRLDFFPEGWTNDFPYSMPVRINY